MIANNTKRMEVMEITPGLLNRFGRLREAGSPALVNSRFLKNAGSDYYSGVARSQDDEILRQ
jgi:hypothetical protein